MAFWRQVTRGLRRIASRDEADRDAADEVAHYLDQATAELVAQGLSPEAARLAARRQLGSETAVREQVRSYGWENTVGSLLADLRYGARRLRATPGFTAVTVLTLAIGIGGSTAIFSAVHPIIFASLPYPHADRIVSIDEVYENGSRSQGTFAMYRQFAERAHAFEAVAVFRAWQPTITGGDRAERFDGQRVSAAYFRVLGVAPALGRDFDPSEDRPGGARTVILSDGLWRRRFNADLTIVGRQIHLDDNPYTVAGVLPAGFENVAAPSAAMWTLLQYDPSLPNGREWGHHLGTIGRLRPEATMGEASKEVSALGKALIAARHPETYDPNTGFTVALLRDDLTRGVRPGLIAILGAVGLVLAIACVNVTNLLLARGARRRGEFALRVALGAGRVRIVRQLLTESLLLAAAGGLAGVGVADVGVRGLIALAPAGLPRAGAIGVNGPVLLFAAAITLTIGLLFGVIPALQAARNDPHQGIQRGSSRSVAGYRSTRRILVVAEVALALVLLVGSGLLLHSLQRLFAVPLGFDPDGLTTMQIQLVGHRYDSAAAAQQLFDRQLEAVRRVPGVVAAGFTSQLPLSGDRDEYGAHFNATATQAAGSFPVFRYAISDGYLETARIPLRAGRGIDRRDTATAPPVALISESLAKSRFGRTDPIGQRVALGPSMPYTIVGVVGDVRQVSLALNDADAVYISAAQSWFVDSPRSLVVRAHESAALVSAIREAVWSIDKDQPIVRVATMPALVASSAAERRFALVLFEAFGLTALVLAAIGIYGVLAGSVSERTREMGVRAALGASRTELTSMIVRQGLGLAGLGIVLGLIAAAVASRALVTLLFGISRLDPATYLEVVVLLIAASALASWIPAWRAARVDPSITLRAE